MNSGNLINHSSVNWDQFKDSLCYLCLPGTESNILVSYTGNGRLEDSNLFYKNFYKFYENETGRRENYTYLFGIKVGMVDSSIVDLSVNPSVIIP